MIELSDQCPECGEYNSMESVWADERLRGYDSETGWDLQFFEIKENCTECGFTQIKEQ